MQVLFLNDKSGNVASTERGITVSNKLCDDLVQFAFLEILIRCSIACAVERQTVSFRKYFYH